MSDQISVQIKSEINETREKVKDQNVKVKEELLDIQLQSMKDNLIFYNIPEVNGEDCVSEIHKFIEEKLHIKSAKENVKIKSANRLGKEGEKIRPILVNFDSYTKRQEIRKCSPLLKGTDFGISEQLPSEILKRGEHFYQNLRNLETGNLKHTLYGTKFSWRGKEYVPT